MIITISGSLGSGKSTIAKMLCKRLGYKHYSMGDFQRELAKEKGISLLELSKLEEKDKSLDKLVDEKQRALGLREDNFIIDSRIGFHFIPHSVKIFLEVKEEVAAKRIFNDKRGVEESNTSIEKTIQDMRKRKQSEIDRYKEYYGINHYDMSNYDFILDTSELTPEEIVDKVLAYLKTNSAE